jgi:hypothetical protein
MVTRMADSVSPWLIPEAYRQYPSGVAGYADGLYAWSGLQAAHWPRKIWITVTGASPHARCIDVERGDAAPAGVPAFYRARKAISEHAEVMVYCDRSAVPQVAAAMRDDGLDYDELLWWIATLDGQPWTAPLLSSAIAEDYGVTIHPDDIWACQWNPMGSYDESFVFAADPRWDTHT